MDRSRVEAVEVSPVERQAVLAIQKEDWSPRDHISANSATGTNPAEVRPQSFQAAAEGQVASQAAEKAGVRVPLAAVRTMDHKTRPWPEDFL